MTAGHDHQVDITGVVGNDYVKPVLVCKRQRAGKRRDDEPAVDNAFSMHRMPSQMMGL